MLILIFISVEIKKFDQTENKKLYHYQKVDFKFYEF